MIQVCSMFRDSEHYLERYFSQVNALRELLDVHLVIAEGDSTDDTYGALQSYLTCGDTFLKVDHGVKKYGSMDHPVRWASISVVVRAILDELVGAPVLWVESDLIWEPQAMVQLVDDLEEVPAVAPLVLADDGKRFYDTWGFRIDGQMFSTKWPFYEPRCVKDQFVKIDSCGSCFALASLPALREWDGKWPFRAGGQLWLDPMVKIEHP